MLIYNLIGQPIGPTKPSHGFCRSSVRQSWRSPPMRPSITNIWDNWAMRCSQRRPLRCWWATTTRPSLRAERSEFSVCQEQVLSESAQTFFNETPASTLSTSLSRHGVRPDTYLSLIRWLIDLICVSQPTIVSCFNTLVSKNFGHTAIGTPPIVN